MAVRVRMFAALRDAAGESETVVEAGSVQAMLDELRERYGDGFARRLERSAVLLDGQPVWADDARIAPDGAELALLPPVSGGQEGLLLPAPGASA